MPFEDTPREALAALAAARETFHAAVSAAADQVRALLDESRAPAAGPGTRAAGTLGAFAAGRIDAERFAALFAGEQVLDDRALAVVERGLEVLTEIAAAGDDAYRVDVPANGDMGAAVHAALGRLGRAFAAARAVEAARSGAATAVNPAEPFPFHRWNRAERAIAPPLVVVVDGGDLRAGSLVPYLDGGQKFVLLVKGAAAPAPLVRLLTPGTLLVQTTAAAALADLAGWDGPAVGALLPKGAAEFIHAPLGGAALPDRLRVATWPETPPARPVGGLTAAQQNEELAQLRALAGLSAREVAPSTDGKPAAQPADKLAAWLLRQTHLSDVA